VYELSSTHSSFTLKKKNCTNIKDEEFNKVRNKNKQRGIPRKTVTMGSSRKCSKGRMKLNWNPGRGDSDKN